MSRAALPTLIAVLLVVATLFPSQVFGEPTAAPAAVSGRTPDPGLLTQTVTSARACPTGGLGSARCHAQVRTDARARGALPARVAVPSAGTLGNSGAYDPSYLQSAYNLTAAASSAGHAQTVAIVDAYDDPNAESDLAYYRSYFGLPPCTTANGCFRKVNENGAAGPYPSTNAGWAQEISLDLDMVSAICPNCNILLVEATSNGFADLGASVNTAAMLGATAISNSYGGSEWSGETGYWESFYNHPGIAVTASAGDSGYGVEFPAATGYAIAVGGTTLNQATNSGTRDATETVWSGSGSGCSAYEPKPTWQHDSGCAQRTVADVAAVADPATGVWVYDSVPSAGQSGWLVFGGTSVASPIVSSIFALAANTSVQAASGIYAATGGSLFDILSGSNGTCGGSYLCTGETGYDGPTGNGTPNNTTAFTSAAAPTPTSTPVTVATSTPTPLPTSTPTSLPTSTPTSTPISTPTATATPTQTPQSTYSTSATTSPTSVARGSRVSVTTSVTSANASSVLVDVEIYDPSGARVYQKWWNNQSFSAGQTRSFTTSWSVPTSAATGGYTVKVGIYRNGWGTLYNWNNAAALFSVT